MYVGNAELSFGGSTQISIGDIPIGACIPVDMWSKELGGYYFKALCSEGGTIQIYTSNDCKSDSKATKQTNSKGVVVTTVSPADFHCELNRDVCGSVLYTQHDEKGVCNPTNYQGNFSSEVVFLDACYTSPQHKMSAYATCSGDVLTAYHFNNALCTNVSETMEMKTTCDFFGTDVICDENWLNCTKHPVGPYQVDVVCQPLQMKLTVNWCAFTELTDNDWEEVRKDTEKLAVERTQAKAWSASSSTSSSQCGTNALRRLSTGGGGGRMITVTVGAATEGDKNTGQSTLDELDILEELRKECESELRPKKDFCAKLHPPGSDDGISDVELVIIIICAIIGVVLIVAGIYGIYRWHKQCQVKRAVQAQAVSQEDEENPLEEDASE